MGREPMLWKLLEACLFLTQSTCAVPGVLASELKLKTLNFSQYLQKGGLNKTKPEAWT